MLSLAIQLYTMPIQLYHYFTFPMLGTFSEPDRDFRFSRMQPEAVCWRLEFTV